MSPAPVQMRPRAIVYPNHLTKFSRGGNGFIKLLGSMMLTFQFAAVSRLKSLTAGALKCMCLRTRWLAEEHPARQNIVEQACAYLSRYVLLIQIFALNFVGEEIEKFLQNPGVVNLKV